MGRRQNRPKLSRAQKDARSKIQKQSSVILELHRYAEFFSKNDIEDWRRAWQSAIDPRHPSRLKLYDIYRDAMTDSHLSGCIQQRVGFVMSRSFKLVNDNGDQDEAAEHLFDQSWFKDLCRLCLESIWYGHSLIELGDVITDGDGHPAFSGISLIPRKHVVPEKGRVVQRVGMNWETGIEFRERPWRDWLIEAGRPDDLGLLLKAALHTIPKKHAMTFWDCFAEIFGMPWRIARTSTRDPKEFKRLEDMIYNGGASQGMVAGMETEIQFVESGKGDAFNVYDKRIDRANSELSKLVIGQTMTIEDGSSLSQSQTHLEVFMNLVESDRDFLRDIINNQLIPLMVLHGFPVKGLRFEWDDAVDYTPEQQVAYETMIADRYEVDPSYFADKYNMPVGERRNPMALPPADNKDKEADDDKSAGDGKEKKHFFDWPPSDYEGLHRRYASLLGSLQVETLASPGDDLRKRLSSLFNGMMKSLFKEKGAEFRVELVADPAVQEFVGAHASALDSAFEKVEMSEVMRRRLTRSNYIFSGMKAFHELHEAFPSLLDENGNRKTFERFLNDVQSIDKTYNANYLRAEYNFVAASAEMAGRWEQFMADGDRYNLQYRTQRDDKVRPEHAALDRVTLPPSDSFWEEFYPPNGWNCRCTVVQVRKSKYPATPHDEAMRLGDEALQRDTKGIFRFNAGKEGKSVPDYNPYTIRRCSTCPIAKGNKERKLAFVPDNEVCQACAIFHECAGNAEKSATAIERKHYLKEMEPLLARRCEKTVGDNTSVTVGSSTYGNKHLFSDTFSRSRVLTKDDLKNLDELLTNATYSDESGLTHPRTDGIEHFYYFQTTLRGREIRLNVAKKVETDPHGRTRASYFLYSVNDI